MNNYVHRMLCRNYERSAKLMVEENRRVRNEVTLKNSEIYLEYMENLKMLRLFLDNCGMPMPKPKWHYDDKDESTWLFTHRKDLNKNFMMLQARKR
jgi:hypothetical protein